MPVEADEKVVRLDDIRAKREAARTKRIGYCGRGLKEACAMRNQAECWLHGPLLPADAS